MSQENSTRDTANQKSFNRLCEAEPVLIDVSPAIDVVPGMTRETILTSGPPMLWSDYTGGQRDAVLGTALFEGLAHSREEADTLLSSGDIKVDGCHDYNCVGSLAGVYSASMPVFVVENKASGNFSYCNMYEGTDPRRLNYGVYNEDVKQRLNFVADVIAPVIGKSVRLAGGIPLKPLMKRALHMGDELHSRSTAASLLFTREIMPQLIEQVADNRKGVEQTLNALTEDHYFFLRLSMAAAKATADYAHGIAGSSMVTAMAFNCKGFAIRVSGLGDTWFMGPHAEVEAKLFEGHTEDEITWMGGESIITETIGLGGFAQACAFALQHYQGGSAQAMIERNEELYDITLGENPDYHIPVLNYRGTPTGIDIFKVIESGVKPAMDVGIAGKDGGQIGAGLVRAPMKCFLEAKTAYEDRYGKVE
jgi:hypothetical protein